VRWGARLAGGCGAARLDRPPAGTRQEPPEAGPVDRTGLRERSPRLADGQAYVRFVEVEKSYDGETLVVRKLSLDVARGEFLTLLGPSGSGRSRAPWSSSLSSC
jgi:ABC-type glutathione transport system ATPase component